MIEAANHFARFHTREWYQVSIYRKAPQPDFLSSDCGAKIRHFLRNETGTTWYVLTRSYPNFFYYFQDFLVKIIFFFIVLALLNPLLKASVSIFQY